MAMINVWRTRAVMARYGHVPLSQILGRDLVTEPLSSVETALFSFAIFEHVTAERKPLAELGIPPNED